MRVVYYTGGRIIDRIAAAMGESAISNKRIKKIELSVDEWVQLREEVDQYLLYPTELPDDGVAYYSGIKIVKEKETQCPINPN